MFPVDGIPNFAWEFGEGLPFWDSPYYENMVQVTVWLMAVFIFVVSAMSNVLRLIPNRPLLALPKLCHAIEL
jgi:hypothetical protein